MKTPGPRQTVLTKLLRQVPKKKAAKKKPTRKVPPKVKPGTPWHMLPVAEQDKVEAAIYAMMRKRCKIAFLFGLTAGLLAMLTVRHVSGSSVYDAYENGKRAGAAQQSNAFEPKTNAP